MFSGNQGKLVEINQSTESHPMKTNRKVDHDQTVNRQVMQKAIFELQPPPLFNTSQSRDCHVPR